MTNNNNLLERVNHIIGDKTVIEDLLKSLPRDLICPETIPLTIVQSSNLFLTIYPTKADDRILSVHERGNKQITVAPSGDEYSINVYMGSGIRVYYHIRVYKQNGDKK